MALEPSSTRSVSRTAELETGAVRTTVMLGGVSSRVRRVAGYFTTAP